MAKMRIKNPHYRNGNQTVEISIGAKKVSHGSRRLWKIQDKKQEVNHGT